MAPNSTEEKERMETKMREMQEEAKERQRAEAEYNRQMADLIEFSSPRGHQ